MYSNEKNLKRINKLLSDFQSSYSPSSFKIDDLISDTESNFLNQIGGADNVTSYLVSKNEIPKGLLIGNILNEKSLILEENEDRGENEGGENEGEEKNVPEEKNPSVDNFDLNSFFENYKLVDSNNFDSDFDEIELNDKIRVIFFPNCALLYNELTNNADLTVYYFIKIKDKKYRFSKSTIKFKKMDYEFEKNPEIENSEKKIDEIFNIIINFKKELKTGDQKEQEEQQEQKEEQEEEKTFNLDAYLEKLYEYNQLDSKYRNLEIEISELKDLYISYNKNDDAFIQQITDLESKREEAFQFVKNVDESVTQMLEQPLPGIQLNETSSNSKLKKLIFDKTKEKIENLLNMDLLNENLQKLTGSYQENINFESTDFNSLYKSLNKYENSTELTELAELDSLDIYQLKTELKKTRIKRLLLLLKENNVKVASDYLVVDGDQVAKVDQKDYNFKDDYNKLIKLDNSIVEKLIEKIGNLNIEKYDKSFEFDITLDNKFIINTVTSIINKIKNNETFDNVNLYTLIVFIEDILVKMNGKINLNLPYELLGFLVKFINILNFYDLNNKAQKKLDKLEKNINLKVETIETKIDDIVDVDFDSKINETVKGVIDLENKQPNEPVSLKDLIDEPVVDTEEIFPIGYQKLEFDPFPKFDAEVIIDTFKLGVINNDSKSI